MFAFHCLFSWMMTTVVVPICTHMSTTVVIYQYLHPLPMYFICELETTSWIVYNSCAPSISAGKTLVQGQEGTLRLSVEIPSLRGNLGWLVAVLFCCTLTFKQNRGRCDGEASHPRLQKHEMRNFRRMLLHTFCFRLVSLGIVLEHITNLVAWLKHDCCCWCCC